jgi:hypothetical protein
VHDQEPSEAQPVPQGAEVPDGWTKAGIEPERHHARAGGFDADQSDHVRLRGRAVTHDMSDARQLRNAEPESCRQQTPAPRLRLTPRRSQQNEVVTGHDRPLTWQRKRKVCVAVVDHVEDIRLQLPRCERIDPEPG